ncbi:MAG: FHA domain-containing protein [Terrimesophilobacter sp.]
MFLAPRVTAPVEPAPVEPAPVEPAPTAAPMLPADPTIASGVTTFDDDVESTRIVGRHQTGERFVLQFSTGESVTVYGSGLIGRNPRAEPGEHFDHVVRIVDVTRSVSKTHLEFGQESGTFWIKDRFSGNGTAVREPDAPPVRVLPDHRHRLARGSRVDMGEQFFVVS